MYSVLHIILFRLRQMLKEPSNIILLFVMPIVFSLIFGSFALDGGGEPPKAVIVAENCELCGELSGLIAKNPSFTWEYQSEEEARTLVAERKVVAAIVVEPQPYERIQAGEAPYRVIMNEPTEDYIVLSQFVRGIVNMVLMQHEVVRDTGEAGLVQVPHSINATPLIELQQQSYQAYLLKGEDQARKASQSTRAIGFTIMFLMFTLSGTAAVIYNERKDFTWQRLRTTAATFSQIIWGYIGSFWVLGWLQFAVMLLFIYIVYGSTWGLYLVPFVSLMIFMVVAFSMMLVTLIKSKKQAEALSSIIVVSTCMLGGVYWPLDIVPDMMQKIALVIPQYWMMQGMSDVALNITDWSIMWKPWLILSIYSILCLTVAIRKLSKEQ